MTAIEKQQWEQVNEAYPVAQARHTGLWGWERVNGGIDLSKCRFLSRLAATRDRNRMMRVYNEGGDYVTDYPGSR
jgi:hypothetical protein